MKNAGRLGRGAADVNTESVARMTNKMENIFMVVVEGIFAWLRVWFLLWCLWIGNV